jgi:hypothetical protein
MRAPAERSGPALSVSPRYGVLVASTDIFAVQHVLGALQQSDMRWALVHGRRQSTQVVSDIDIAVADVGRRGWIALLDRLAERGLQPVLVWPYDVNSVSIFLGSRSLTQGVQLDILQDPRGGSKYGLRTDAALDHAELENGMPVLTDVDSWLYNVRKQSLKRQNSRLARLIADQPAPTEQLVARAAELFSSFACTQVVGLLHGKSTRRRQVSPGHEAIRAVRRLRTAAGTWIHITDGSAALAEDIASRLGRFVVRSEAMRWPPGGYGVTALKSARLAVTRRRASTIVTFGPPCSQADVRVDGSRPPDEVAEAVRVAASTRARDQLVALRWSTTGQGVGGSGRG